MSVTAVALVALQPKALADIKLPAIFSDHMVLQRDRPCPVWGSASPGEEVRVSFAGQEQTTKADESGHWRVVLDPLSAPGGGELTIAGENEIELSDVAVGEVWVCSGQSNMQFSVDRAFNSELNIAAGDRAEIRLISIHSAGTQVPQETFEGAWERATPDAVAQFSAVGYGFGERLQETLGVPVGLIDNAWGGSACEAWVPRGQLAQVESCQPILAKWEKRETPEAEAEGEADAKKWHNIWRQRAREAQQRGERVPEPSYPRHAMVAQHRPANLFNARVAPIAGFAIRGAIWYQGETNARRAQQYRDLFPLMIQSWREAWSQNDFSFYWVQLADFKGESNGTTDSAWAELREAQTMAIDKLPNSGQAVIIDLGNGVDIHPRDKQEVANRLAKLALAKDYGLNIQGDSPRFRSVDFAAGKAVVRFNHPGGGLYSKDSKTVKGFAIAGEDKVWRKAKAKVSGRDQVEVWSDEVAAPVAVRYAWADNPVCNLYSREGLPVTPFRTDDWPGVTDGKR